MLTFGGMRFARGPLTLGQRIVLENAGHPGQLERVVPVPSGADLPDVCDAVYALVCRHETLRTRFPAGGREQVVDGAGMLPLRMCDSVEEARAALTAEPFDISGEWGIRVAIVGPDDRPRSVFLCLSRLAVDAWAADLVVDDLTSLLRTTDRRRVPSTRQPVDLAAAEQEPDSLARQANALAHLREVLLGAPPDEATAATAEWHLGELRSGAVDPAARVVATRCHTTASVVYLAAAAAGLGPGPHVLKTVTHNRLTPEETALVAPFAMATFVPVDVSGEKFDAVVSRTCEAYREAERHGRYDPAAVRPLVAEIAEERGSVPDLSMLVNDRRAGTRPVGGTVATTFRWGEPCQPPGLTRYLAITDDGDAVTLSLLANDVRDRVPEFLHGMAELIVAAADGDV